MKKPKKNPQDATLRNIRALKKRVKTLEDCLSWALSPEGTTLIIFEGKEYELRKTRRKSKKKS